MAKLVFVNPLPARRVRRFGAVGSGAARFYLYLLSGIRGETVTDVSQRLPAHHGGLRGIFRLDVAELARIRGLGDAKAVRVKAALELGRRLAALSPEERPPVGSPEDVANLLGAEMTSEHLIRWGFGSSAMIGRSPWRRGWNGNELMEGFQSR